MFIYKAFFLFTTIIFYKSRHGRPGLAYFIPYARPTFDAIVPSLMDAKDPCGAKIVGVTRAKKIISQTIMKCS